VKTRLIHSSHKQAQVSIKALLEKAQKSTSNSDSIPLILSILAIRVRFPGKCESIIYPQRLVFRDAWLEYLAFSGLSLDFKKALARFKLCVANLCSALFFLDSTALLEAIDATKLLKESKKRVGASKSSKPATHLQAIFTSQNPSFEVVLIILLTL
jgi:hypothetical protein